MGGYVDRLRKKPLLTDSGDPFGEAKNNSDPAMEIEKLFGPIEISDD